MPDLPNTKTSIDLELDLAAQQSKLTVLNEEIDRLRQIKSKMEEAKDKGWAKRRMEEGALAGRAQGSGERTDLDNTEACH